MNTEKELCFVSVDVEASGPMPPSFSMLSLGACLVDDDTVTFQRLLRPISGGADPKAMRVSRLSMAELSRTGSNPSDAMAEFGQWILAHAGTRTPVFVGLNAAFDWAFVNYYFLTYASSNPFGFAPLDIKAYYAGATGTEWLESRSSRMSQRLGATKRATHDALDDAVAQAELFRLTRDLVSRRQ
jgi:DNA polymerase III epsilon subunit-like protein